MQEQPKASKFKKKIPLQAKVKWEKENRLAESQIAIYPGLKHAICPTQLLP